MVKPVGTVESSSFAVLVAREIFGAVVLADAEHPPSIAERNVEAGGIIPIVG
ncbi:hypothetical protein [Halorussus marinus]|uniref:hypothetical protein n=1 Tax=Halorussus marinus TaxID=2505976 RepID=UPI00143DB81E|nr:hypothetical protein [Halorussus marinus]